WSESTAEVKYFLASGSRCVGRILRVGFRRWTVEHVFRVAKQEVGLMDFEGRTHAASVAAPDPESSGAGVRGDPSGSPAGGKSGTDAGAGVRGAEPAVRRGADPSPGRVRSPAGGPSDSIPPDAK